MTESVQKAINDITYRSKVFPEEAFQTISKNREEAIPFLRAALEKAVAEKDKLNVQYQLHFYALFFLGEFQARECFPLIMEMASLPTDILDYLIGGTVTEGLPQILYHTYNGDLELLKKAIRNQESDEFARTGMLRVMGQLYLDGSLGKDEWEDFIREEAHGDERDDSYIYTGLADVICDCNMKDMLPEIRYLYERERIDESAIGRYDDCVDRMFRKNRDTYTSPIDAAKMLRGWAMFEEPKRDTMEKKSIDKLFKALEREYNAPEKTVKIGRNDPCPCGSGKKYKKCCLNKPKPETAAPESESEKEKWLKRYPAAAQEREEGRIYLEDYYDAESIEIDKLLYLALKHRPAPIWSREPEEVKKNRVRAYLSEAFPKFISKAEQENVKTFQEYDDKFSIHYQCKEWLEVLLELAKEDGDDKLGGAVSACLARMDS